MLPGIVCAAVVAISAAPSSAEIVYVDDIGDGRPGTGSPSDPWRDLQAAIDAAEDGDTVAIMPGIYEARPTAFVEELCGNCENHRTKVEASYGFIVRGKSLTLRGRGRLASVLVTNSGYGMLFEDSPSSVVSDLTITGGVRDADGMATDAGIVARRSTVTVTRTAITDNTDRHEDVVVGIGGVMGREGAQLFIMDNTIENNGWDGIALYRGSVAFVADNEISRGRGAGIGVTWDAAAVLLRNRISGYWKGIGSFGSSRVVARNNEVFDNLGWGIIATGTSTMEAMNNVVARNGNCGVALWSEDAVLVLVNNIITENGWRDEWVCPRVGFWLNGDPENLSAGFNDVWGNAEGDYRGRAPLTGTRGNISLEPLFADSLDFGLITGSPCRDAGDPAVTDPEGGRSDMGSCGGPNAARKRPESAGKGR